MFQIINDNSQDYSLLFFIETPSYVLNALSCVLKTTDTAAKVIQLI